MSYMFVLIFEAIGHVTLVLEPENRPASLAQKAVSFKNGLTLYISGYFYTYLYRQICPSIKKPIGK